MLRFAVRRLGGRRASPRCHRASRGDVSGCVDVRAAPQSAGDTPESHLARTRRGCHTPAGRKTRPGVGRRYSLDPAGSLLLQPLHEQTPAGREDHPIHPGLLPRVASRLGDHSPRRPGHGRNPQLRAAQRRADGHPPVHPDHLARTRRRHRRGHDGERHIPATRPIPSDPIRFCVRRGTAATEPHPAHLGNPHLRPLVIDPPNITGSRRRHPETLMLAPLRKVGLRCEPRKKTERDVHR